MSCGETSISDRNQHHIPAIDKHVLGGVSQCQSTLSQQNLSACYSLSPGASRFGLLCTDAVNSPYSFQERRMRVVE